jgi:hypothetical protein
MILRLVILKNQKFVFQKEESKDESKDEDVKIDYGDAKSIKQINDKLVDYRYKGLKYV